MNDPTREYHKMYRVEASHGAADAAEWTFLNLPMDELEALGVASLKGGDRFYFTCDTYQDALADEGVYDVRLSPVFGYSMTKEELYLSRDISSAHAMAMCGFAMGPDGKVSKWVSENSFGLSRGYDGYVVMQADWWRRYTFRMAVDVKYLSDSQRSMLGQTAELIPRWNLY
jgi:bleomycin hydrolase